MGENYTTYAFPVLILVFFFYRILRGKQMKKILPDLIKNGAVIIDVRSTSEFAQGANQSSINIPLDQLSEKSLSKFAKDIPIILCCASGMRSGIAVSTVKNFGFSNVVNAGPWTNTL